MEEGVEKKATRDGFGEGLVAAGEKDGRVVAVCADLTESTRMEAFAKRFPERFIQVGVAEQNLVTVGSGLAAVGKIPFVASYAAFSPGRNWEQIRTTIGYNDRAVIVVGSHAGVSVGPDGATHQMLEDIALMRVMANMSVVSPCDSAQAKKATMAAAAWGKPLYLRLARDKSPVMTSEETPFEMGKAQVMRWGEGASIIATGSLVYEALVAGERMNAEVINVHTIKPLDEETILASVAKTGRVVTLEEHQVAGGLGGAVAELLSTRMPVKIKRLGMMDRYGESGETRELLEKFGLTAESVVKAIESQW